MAEARIIPGMQELIRAEAGVRARVAEKRLKSLLQEVRESKSGMEIGANSAVLPELPEALRRRVAGGATIIVDYTGGLIIHQNGKK